MHPTGFVGSALTKSVGDSMVSGFKRGDFYGALCDASASLNKLALNPPTPTKHVVTTTTTTHAETHQRSHSLNQPIAVRPVYRDDTAILWTLLYIVLIVVGVIFVVWLVCKFVEWLSEPKVVVHERIIERDRPVSSSVQEQAREKLTDTQKAEAQRLYSSYSPAQRQQIARQCVGSPYYYGGIYNDPYSFMYMMMMMNMMNNHYNGYYQQQYAGYAASPVVSDTSTDTTTDTTTTTTTTTEDNYKSNDSGSDDSGSGGSWDSSPTPSSDSDSGGGSDSGSGGSWGGDDGGSSSSSDSSSGYDSGGGGSYDSGGGGSFDSGGGSSDSGGGGSW